MTFEEWDAEATTSCGAIPYQAEMGRHKVWRRAAWYASQEAMRERAAVSQCWYCQQGRPIDHIDLGKAFHSDSKGCPTMCTGQDIRALPVE